MRVLAALCFAVLALPAASASPEAPLLGLLRDRDTLALRLVEVDPATLAPAGASLELPEKSYQAWGTSPDGRLVALGPWDVPRVTIVRRDGLRVVREVPLPAGRYAFALAWVSPERLLALVGSCCRPGTAVALIDAVRGRVVASRAVSGGVSSVTVAPRRLVLLLSPGTLGPARLAVAGPDGRVRAVALPRTRAGAKRLSADDFATARRTPGVAVDPERLRAYVVGAGEPVAEVDLATLRVRYHALAPARAPQAVTKSVEGPWRTAEWVGDGVLALTGWNGRRLASGRTRVEPAGAHLVDTRTWRRRTLAEGAQTLDAAAGAVAVPLRDRLAIFGTDGHRRFAVPGGGGWLQLAAGRAYWWRERAGLLVADLRTGAVTPSPVADAPTLLVP